MKLRSGGACFLTNLSANDLAFVVNALAFVRLRLFERANLRGGLADSILIDTCHLMVFLSTVIATFSLIGTRTGNA